MIRLQKALKSIAYQASLDTKKTAYSYSRDAFERAELAIKYKGDLEILRNECLFENL